MHHNSVMAQEAFELDTRSLQEVALHTAVLALTTVLSLTGNSLVCLAFYRNRRLRTVTNFYVLSLAIADLILALFVSCSSTLASGLRRWPFHYNFCQFTGFVAALWGQISTSILALASINRYYCVVKAPKYSTLFSRKKTFSSICVAWIFCLFQTLIWFAAPVVYKWSPYELFCRSTFNEEQKERIFYIYFGCLFTVPMLVIGFCYNRVYRNIRQHNKNVIHSLQEAHKFGISAQEIKTSRVLFAAVLGFIICWAPFIVISVIVFGFHISIPSSAKPIYPIFCFISSWINPIIYGVMNRAMRQEFQSILGLSSPESSNNQTSSGPHQ